MSCRCQVSIAGICYGPITSHAERDVPKQACRITCALLEQLGPRMAIAEFLPLFHQSLHRVLSQLPALTLDWCHCLGTAALPADHRAPDRGVAARSTLSVGVFIERSVFSLFALYNSLASQMHEAKSAGRLYSVLVLFAAVSNVASVSPSPAPPVAQLKQEQQQVQNTAAAVAPSCTFNIQGAGTQKSPELSSANISCYSRIPGTSVSVVGGSLLSPFAQYFTGAATSILPYVCKHMPGQLMPGKLGPKESPCLSGRSVLM